jgi:hypothetical protein
VSQFQWGGAIAPLMIDIDAEYFMTRLFQGPRDIRKALPENVYSGYGIGIIIFWRNQKNSHGYAALLING